MSARALVNLELRNEYTVDCAKGLRRWNRTLSEAGIDVEFSLPDAGFNRKVGAFSGVHVQPDGKIVSEEEWLAGNHLPSDEERAHVSSLMTPVYEPGKMASWIAPPSRGINTKPVEYDYVRL